MGNKTFYGDGLTSNREGEKLRTDTGSPPRTQEASREDSGYENGIIGESRACSGGKWITFRKEHREKHPGDEVDPFTNIFDIKGILVRIPFIDKSCTPFPTYNHGQRPWDTLAFLGCSPIHTGPTPPLTPQTKMDACIQNFFRVSTLYRMGDGRRENCKKISKRISSVL